MEKKVKEVPENIYAKMKELERMCEKAGVNLLCVASTGTTLTHYVNGDSVPLVTLGERYMLVREMLIHAADILQARLTRLYPSLWGTPSRGSRRRCTRRGVRRTLTTAAVSTDRGGNGDE